MTMALRGLGEIQPAPRPECYSYLLSECVHGDGPNDFPGCALIRGELSAQPQGDLQQHLKSIPICPTDLERVEATLSYLPSCYSGGLDDCLNADDPLTHPYPHCQEINDAYDMDERPVMALPYCTEPKEGGVSWGMLALSAVGAGVLGFFVGKLV